MLSGDSLPGWAAKASDFTRTAFYWLADGLVVGGGRSGGAGVALVRLDAIGDFVMWLDCARRLREHHAGQRITLVANAAWADLARALPYWDEVWPVKLAGPESIFHPLVRWRLLRKLRRAGFDRVVQPVYSREFLTGDSLVRATGARERIGSVGDGSNIGERGKRMADKWYTSLVPAVAKPLPEMERNAEFLRGLCLPDYKAVIPQMPEAARLAPELQIKQPYFIVFPGAARTYRQWPIERFASVIAQTCKATDWTPVLCGGPGEAGLCESLAALLQVPSVNLAGKTSLAQFAEVARGAKLMIGNETSAIHIAASVGTPSVCIAGGGHYDRFLPYPPGLSGMVPVVAHKRMPCYGCGWTCTQPHEPGSAFPCIAAVSVDAVGQAVDSALGKRFAVAS